jgi:hypothetical protein
VKRRAGTVDICGLPFSVWLADEEGEPGLKKLDGFCLSRECRIVVRDGLPPAYARSVLEHEVLHGVWYHSGCPELVSGSTPDSVEENMVSVLTLHLPRAWASAKRVKL